MASVKSKKLRSNQKGQKLFMWMEKKEIKEAKIPKWCAEAENDK